MRQPAFWDPRPEGDIQVHKRSPVPPAVLHLPPCAEAHLRHPAKKPQRQTVLGSDSQPRVLQGAWELLLLQHLTNCFCSSSSTTSNPPPHPPPFLHLPCDLFQGFTPDKLPPSSCMMVPELHPPSPAKKFFTKMAKSLFGKKKSKGERPSDDTRYVQDSPRRLCSWCHLFPPPLNSSASLLSCSGEDSVREKGGKGHSQTGFRNCQMFD